MSDQRIQYTESMVGAGHPSLSDTLNRLAVIEHENDGTHRSITQGTGFSTKLFNTTDEATNWEALVFDWSLDVARIRVDKAGVGAYRALEFYANGAVQLRLPAAGGVDITGILALGTTVRTGAAAGDAVLAHNSWLRTVSNDATTTYRLAGARTGQDQNYLGEDLLVNIGDRGSTTPPAPGANMDGTLWIGFFDSRRLFLFQGGLRYAVSSVQD